MVAVGDLVATGQLLGTVLTQVNAPAPSHLHLEVRTFLTTPRARRTSPPLWSAPSDEEGAERVDDLALTPGDAYPWLALATGRASSKGSSAGAYRLWYRVETLAAGPAWLQAVLPDAGDTGSDGLPSSVSLVLVPAMR